jgi:FKBP-type peptidyl-prolyl cis-trans isomerase FklB
MADFIKGFNEAMEKGDNPSYNAYAAGIQIADMVKSRMFPGIEKELEGTSDALVRSKFVEGFVAALKNDTSIYNQQTSASYFESRMKANHEAKQEKLYGANREAGKKFLAENAKKEGVVTTPSGLQYKILTKGTGPIPTASQEVKVKYEGKLLDGTIFDSSYKRSDPITKFRCNQVIKGWTEALTMMPVGSTWELYIPYELAYGEHDQGKIKPFSMLIFKVELVGIEGAEAEKPAEVAKAPVKAAPKAAPKKAGKKK